MADDRNNELLEDLRKLQADWNERMHSDYRVTQHMLQEICRPFGEKYGLTYKEVATLAQTPNICTILADLMKWSSLADFEKENKHGQ